MSADAVSIETYSKEIAKSVVVNYQGEQYLTPIKGLSERMGPGNNQRSLFLSPSSFSSVTSGQVGPSTFQWRLDSLGVHFLQEAALTYTIVNNVGGTVALAPYHAQVDRLECIVSGGAGGAQSTSTTYQYNQSLFYSELDRACVGGSWNQIATNIGLNPTLASGVYPALYPTGSRLAQGGTAQAFLRIPDPVTQCEVPVGLSSSEATIRVYWNANAAQYGLGAPALVAGDITLTNIRLYMKGLVLNERLASLLAQRTALAPSIYPCFYWRRYFSVDQALTSGSQNALTLLNSMGQVSGVRFYFAASSSGVDTLSPLITSVGRGNNSVALYSQSQGMYILETSPTQPANVLLTYMALRAPMSPLPALCVYDTLNTKDLLSLYDKGCAGAPYRINPNDAQFQYTAAETATRVIFQLTATMGLLTMKGGSIGVRWFES